MVGTRSVVPWATSPNEEGRAREVALGKVHFTPREKLDALIPPNLRGGDTLVRNGEQARALLVELKAHHERGGIKINLGPIYPSHPSGPGFTNRPTYTRHLVAGITTAHAQDGPAMASFLKINLGASTQE